MQLPRSVLGGGTWNLRSCLLHQFPLCWESTKGNELFASVSILANDQMVALSGEEKNPPEFRPWAQTINSESFDQSGRAFHQK